MAKRKGLPKKYAKMGFKKGWAAYKRAKNARKRSTGTKRAPSRTRKRTYTRKKVGRKMNKGIVIDIGDTAAFVKLLDGIFGIKNITSFDFGLMLDQAVTSFTDPFAEGGLFDDIVDTIIIWVVCKATGKILYKITGRHPGGGIPGVIRIRI